MKNEKVLIVISNLTTFYAIEKDIAEIKKKARVDIVVVEVFNRKVRNDIDHVINSKGYKTRLLTDIKKETYKVLLEPYPLVTDINAEFRIRYEYGVTPSYMKPDPVYSPDWNLFYDAVICYSKIAAEILSAVTKPCIVKPTQFDNFKRHKKTQKINLLVLFTWGDVSATDKLAQIKKQLGEKYNFIIKAHHGIDYLPEHKDDKKKLKQVADEYHDSSTNVNKLLKRADIVLSDNSSAIFTAIYLGIPAAIYTEAKSDYCNLNGIKSAHFSLLIEPKRIAYTNKFGEIKKVIESALKNIASQNKLRNELYPSNINDTLAHVVEKFLKMNRKQEPYYIIRDILIKKKNDAENTILEQAGLIDELKNKNVFQAGLIDELKNTNKELSIDCEELKIQMSSFLSIGRSARLLGGNIKRKIKKIIYG